MRNSFRIVLIALALVIGIIYSPKLRAECVPYYYYHMEWEDGKKWGIKDEWNRWITWGWDKVDYNRTRGDFLDVEWTNVGETTRDGAYCVTNTYYYFAIVGVCFETTTNRTHYYWHHKNMNISTAREYCGNDHDSRH